MPEITSESVASYLYLYGDKQTTIWHFRATESAPFEPPKSRRLSFTTLMDALAHVVAQETSSAFSIVVNQGPMNDRLMTALEAELLVREYLFRDGQL